MTRWSTPASRIACIPWKDAPVGNMRVTRVTIEGEVEGRRVKIEATEHYLSLLAAAQAKTE